MSFHEPQFFHCPHCGSSNDLFLDLTGGSKQKTVTDCTVCCRPIVIEVRLRGEELEEIRVEKENP